MKVVIIGLGSIAKKHIQALNALNIEDLEVFAVRSGDQPSIIKGISNINSISEIDFNPSFFIISNPTNKHYETIESVLKFRVPLFIEKPLFHSLTNVDELYLKINASQINTYVACNLRFHSCIKHMKSLKENGILGQIEEVNSYCGSYLPDWRPDTDFREIYSANKAQGGGVHLDLIHELDYLYWILGAPLKTNSYLRSQSSLNINSFDYAHYVLQYSNFIATVTLNYFRKTPKRELEVICENGVYKINLLTGTIWLNNKIEFQSEEKDIFDSYKTQMNYFITNIYNTKGNNTMNDIHEALEVMKICLHDETT